MGRESLVIILGVVYSEDTFTYQEEVDGDLNGECDADLETLRVRRVSVNLRVKFIRFWSKFSVTKVFFFLSR